ncbi:MAG: hypothetical protein WC280_00630 [Patescibacteria group bacterium]
MKQINSSSIVLWWRRLWIRKDEFHHSLNLNCTAMIKMSKEERDKYLADIVRRRNIAHEKDQVR